jgi:hypothetical protein
MKNSKSIEAFLNFYDDITIRYKTAFEMVNKCDKFTQDLLHRLELEDLSCGEKNKLATQLKYCRKDRRYWKDIVEETEPFVSMFLSTADDKKRITESSKAFINILRSNVLGQVRKQEDYHSSRSYKPRIIKSEDKLVKECANV